MGEIAMSIKKVIFLHLLVLPPLHITMSIKKVMHASFSSSPPPPPPLGCAEAFVNTN